MILRFAIWLNTLMMVYLLHDIAQSLGGAR